MRIVSNPLWGSKINLFLPQRITSALNHKRRVYVKNNKLTLYILVQRLGGSKKKYAMTFDAFVDQIKGLNRAEFETKYPSYKLDKRLA